MLLGKYRKDGGTSSHLRGWIGHVDRFCDLLDHKDLVEDE
jgi:hypothetical protein